MNLRVGWFLITSSQSPRTDIVTEMGISQERSLHAGFHPYQLISRLNSAPVVAEACTIPKPGSDPNHGRLPTWNSIGSLTARLSICLHPIFISVNKQ